MRLWHILNTAIPVVTDWHILNAAIPVVTDCQGGVGEHSIGLDSLGVTQPIEAYGPWWKHPLTHLPCLFSSTASTRSTLVPSLRARTLHSCRPAVMACPAFWKVSVSLAAILPSC